MKKQEEQKTRKNPLYTVESLEIRRGQKKRRDLTTAFGFLSAHNGLRKGKLHVLLSRTGGGKSTLGRSILFDALDNNPDLIVFVYHLWDLQIYSLHQLLLYLRNLTFDLV